MEKFYTIEEARQKMQKSVNFYALRIEAWKNVKRIYKKDGGSFSILSKNFENLKFRNRFGSNEAAVYFVDECGRYADDYINLEANNYTHEEAATTPEAIESKISALIAKYEAWKERDEKGLAEIESRLNAISDALETIKKAVKDAEQVNAHYTMQAYIKGYLNII